MERLDGKVALITDGASGLVKSTGELVAKEGAHVILSDTQTLEGEKVTKSITKEGGGCIFKTHNTTSEKDWEDLCDYIIDNYGH
jgi:cyclopentanol dehydrogenase